MPAKNSVKIYIEGGHYHLYNRGVEKRNIFIDDDDYRTFLNLLKIYLSPKGSDPEKTYYSRRNFYNEINLLAYCLMPNHFHLLVVQRKRDGITNLMRCINTNYVTYFNKKYERVGALFQGKYKAVLIDSDSQLLHLTRYIHLNPTSLKRDFYSYNYSSYTDYLGKRKTFWVNPKPIMDYFKSAIRTKQYSHDHFSYQAFVEDFDKDSEDVLKGAVIDDG